jgi:hypothetical protein
MCFIYGGFQNLNSNISVIDALKLMKRLFLKYHHSHLIMELVLNSAVMKIQKQFFQQNLEILINPNQAPILACIYIYVYMWLY